jgi:hypothetical protein
MEIYAPVLDRKDKTGQTFNYVPVKLTEEMKLDKWYNEGNYLIEVSRDVAFEYFPNFTIYFKVGNGEIQKRSWWSEVFCFESRKLKTHQFPDYPNVRYFLLKNVMKLIAQTPVGVNLIIPRNR